MKIKYVLLLTLLILVIGYSLGQFIPWEYLRPTVTDKQISINDYYTRLVSIIGAVATLFATMVALFKEDIKKLYEYASLEINYKDTNVLSEILDTESSGNSTTGGTLMAKKYEIAINISNAGKLAARTCQIYLEQLTFKNPTFPAPQEIQPSNKPLTWIGKTESAITIPSKAKAFVTIVEILSPESEIVQNSDSSPGKPQIKIAGNDLFFDNYHGLYECTFMIYSENASPKEFKLLLNWNGKWQHRLTEMKTCITVNSTTTRK
ncbi:MAG TPA: hypothetical protein DHW64_04205 [Chitinophagaceae bacterium]|nr:hypothetical protein [Chitinophagaceae bacterium]